eukprot:GHRQ01040240.1.p1 GENE.GHRQ01040240.1~~GHRQ01040240.1.p1  ORF type:complete len:235 (-),score=28.25 GHRQ01040240.1:354-1058(-)
MPAQGKVHADPGQQCMAADGSTACLEHSSAWLQRTQRMATHLKYICSIDNGPAAPKLIDTTMRYCFSGKSRCSVGSNNSRGSKARRQEIRAVHWQAWKASAAVDDVRAAAASKQRKHCLTAVCPSHDCHATCCTLRLLPCQLLSAAVNCSHVINSIAHLHCCKTPLALREGQYERRAVHQPLALVDIPGVVEHTHDVQLSPPGDHSYHAQPVLQSCNGACGKQRISLCQTHHGR